MIDEDKVFCSFRDPAGFVFRFKGKLYRQINRSYSEVYEAIVNSGLFHFLTQRGWLIPFREVRLNRSKSCDQYKIILPVEVPFISYPYEWCFSQIKDAALLTINIHIAALKRGFLLKDASIYNVQYWQGSPTFIDHLSFDVADRFDVWPAYGQFCRHFLAPLTILAKIDVRLGQLYRVHLDGVPLDLCAKLLPLKCLLDPGVFMHIYIHARSQKKFALQGKKLRKTRKLSKNQMIAIAQSLRSTLTRIHWKPSHSEWGDYYSDTNYNDRAMAAKKEIVRAILKKISPKLVWDLGGNIGVMSRLAIESGSSALTFDIDPGVIEKNYLQSKEENQPNLLPLVMDFNNPSPDLGFASHERYSLTARGPADLLLALALIHHLSISNNLPFAYISEYLAKLGNWLVIEFVPKKDSQVQRLLRTRVDIFDNYTEDNFERAFSHHFNILQKEPIVESCRIIYLMKKE